ncbi:MAG: ABC transporter permease [Coriobacteriia bacterium]|nr:ABC transporter permease [Coriobacteriia bacterium]
MSSALPEPGTERDPAPALPDVSDEPVYGAGRSQWQVFSSRFRRHRLAAAAAAVLAVLYAAAVLAPLIVPYDHTEISYLGAQPPSASHPMGTDELGRDQLSRIVMGGRVSLMVGLVVAVVALLAGTAVGMIAGYFGGWLDNVLMRFTDMMLSLPLLPLLMVAGAAFGGTLWNIVLIVGLLSWMPVARLVRGSFLSLREKEFVEAARSTGASSGRIIVRHLLPNAVGPVVVNTTLTVGTAIIVESVLSFLGFGIQPPTPSWGNMLTEAKSTMVLYPWLTWFPGLMIVLTVLCVNFFGDGLRDALDPMQREGVS